jgi:hypothetical protein
MFSSLLISFDIDPVKLLNINLLSSFNSYKANIINLATDNSSLSRFDIVIE